MQSKNTKCGTTDHNIIKKIQEGITARRYYASSPHI